MAGVDASEQGVSQTKVSKCSIFRDNSKAMLKGLILRYSMVDYWYSLMSRSHLCCSDAVLQSS